MQFAVYTRTIETDNAPIVQQLPAIAGAASVGSTLTATNATFTAPAGTGELSAISGQWLRCSDSEAKHCTPIANADGQSYTPTASDAGYYLVYANSAADQDGSTTSDSEPTPAVTSAGGAGPGTSLSLGSGPITLTIGGHTTVGASTLLGSPAKWKITLRGAPLHVHQGTILRLHGAVSTVPRPPAGKVIELYAREVKYRWVRRHGKPHGIPVYGPWTLFAPDHKKPSTPVRTKADGQWEGQHKFKYAGHATYQMRAVAPVENGFLNAVGTSNIITIHET